MRRIKKVLSSLILVCMLWPCITMFALAASAELSFSDPSTTVGAEVEVIVKLSSSSDLGSLDVTLTYDTDMLRFISGDNATGGNGTITLSETGSNTEMRFVLKFQALEEGTGNIEVSQSSGTDSSGSELDITNGSSAVTIGPGDPSLIEPEENGGADTAAPLADGPQVEVDGIQYIVTNDFSDAVIPEGFSRSEMTFEGSTCQVVTQPASGISALYLTPATGGDPDFFLYDVDKGSLIPFEQVSIATERYVIMLRDDGSVSLPDEYQVTKLTLNGKEFTAWQDPSVAEYYVVYALNADGQKVLYQYDTVDKTYQRYIQHTAQADSTEKKAAPKGLWGKILQFIEDFLDIVVILGIMFILILIVVMIVIGVKLYHRNLELDDLYDEYGIDLDEDEKKPSSKSAAGKGKKAASVQRSQTEPAVRAPVKTMNLKDDDIFDDYDDYDDEDRDYDDYDDEDRDYDDYEDEDYSYDSYDDSEDMIDDLDELLSMQSKKKRGHMERDDSFQMDFIDLD